MRTPAHTYTHLHTCCNRPQNWQKIVIVTTGSHYHNCRQSGASWLEPTEPETLLNDPPAPLLFLTHSFKPWSLSLWSTLAYMSSTGALPQAQTMKPKLFSPAAFIGPQFKKKNTVAKAQQLVLHLTLSPPLSSSYLYSLVCFKVLTHRQRICFANNSL